MSALIPLFRALVRLETDLWNATESAVRREHGIPLGRLEVLRVIASSNGCRVNDIVSAMGITVGAVSKLVDRLEEAGLAVRSANPEDRRSSLIEATPAGRKLLADAEHTLDAFLHDHLNGVLDLRTATELETTLTRLAAAAAGIRAPLQA